VRRLSRYPTAALTVGAAALLGALVVPAAHASPHSQAASSAASPAAQSTATGPVVFQDVFANDGNGLNLLDWQPLVGVDNPTGYQLYAPNEDQVDSTGLHLVSQLMSPTTTVLSGAIVTNSSFQYGQFDIVARLPRGDGLWPGLWLYNKDSNGKMNGEIDMVEAFGSHTTWFQSTLHDWSHGVEDPPQCVQVGFVVPHSICANTAGVLPRTDYAAGFHDYGLRWTPTSVTFLMDGKPYWTSNARIPQVPMQLELNVGVGGFWDGPYDSTTPFPTSMDIQSVTVRSVPG
jgi:beta-glucanase (GH16 family)